MGSSELSGNFEIAPDFKVSDWKALFLEGRNSSCEDWAIAVDVLDKRIRHRFIEPAYILIHADRKLKRGKNGFAILAIDFLLIETIQAFKNGCLDHGGKSKKLFEEFLTCWSPFTLCVPEGKDPRDLACDVYRNGRCALHHTGSTDRMVVSRIGDLFAFHEDDRVVINRTLLHEELTKEFDAYIALLKDPKNTTLRENFRLKMKTICS